MTWRWLPVLLVAGCSGVAASPPEAPAVPTDASLSKSGTFEPYLFGGERLSGRVVILGIPAADATVTIDGGCSGGPVTIRTSARATGLFALLAHAWLDMDTTLSPSLAAPESGHTEIEIGQKHRKYSVMYGSGVYRYEYMRSDGPPIFETITLPPGARAHDLHTAVLLIRSWRPVPGTKGEFLVVLGRRLWHVDLVFKGPDVVVGSDGPRPAVEIEGLARKIHTDPGEHTERRFRVWVSDDRDRVPVRVLADSEFGNVEIDATSYACPSCGDVCAPAPSADAGTPAGSNQPIAPR
jgi:hypothetical protein